MKFFGVLFSVVFILSSSNFGQAREMSFKDCGSKVGKLVSFDLSPCSEDPCIIKRGTNVTGTITFIPNEEVTRSKVYAYAIYRGIPIPLPLPNSDGCKGYGLTCPLKSGEQYELVFSYFIASAFPTGKITFKGGLKDQKQNIIYCGEIGLVLR